MLLERVSLNGKPQGKCFVEDCNECTFFRNWSVTDVKTNTPSIEKKCSLEALFYAVPDLIGSVDAAQAAANETRNRVLEYGDTSQQILSGIRDSAVKLVVANAKRRIR